MNDLFNLFGFNFDELTKKLTDFTNALQEKYNNTVNNIKKYDLDTEEGYESFIKDSAEFRKDLETSDGPFSKYMIALLDKSVEYVMKNHQRKLDDQKQQKTVNELVNAEVNRTRNESGKSSSKCNCEKTCQKQEEVSFKWPSDSLTERQKRNVWRYVDKYMDEMVIPYLPKEKRENPEVIEDMSGGLFEFAAWLLNVEED